jgi:TRAP-type C4-dicarboxylate transport system permease small subunit
VAALVTLYNRLLNALGLLPGILIAVIAVGTCADVLLRNLGYSGLYGMLEVIEYCLLALTMAGIGYTMRINRHVTVDILAEYLPARLARPITIMATLLATVISLIFFCFGLWTAISSFESGETIQKAFVIPEWLPVAAIPFGFFFLSIELLRRLYLMLTSRDIAGTGGSGRDGGI